MSENKISAIDYIGAHFMDLFSVEPLLGVLLSTYKIKEDTTIGTMGVTHNTLYFNKGFLKSLDRGELLFILYHELMHVALLHVDKNVLGKLNPKLFNMACDYYINKYIVDAYFNGKLTENSASVVNLFEKRDISLKLHYKNGEFTGLFEEWVDTDKDNIYTIYKKINEGKGSSQLQKILEEHDKEMGTDLSNSDKTMEQIFAQIERELGLSDKFNNGQNSQGNQNQGSNTQGQDGKGTHSSNTKDQDTQQCQDTQGTDGNGGQQCIKGTRRVQTTLDAFVSDGRVMTGDIVDIGDMTDEEVNQLKSALAEAVTNAANMSQSVGTGTGGLLRLVNELLKPKVKWQNIITKELLAFKREDITYSKIDTRYNHLDLTLPFTDKIDIGNLSKISVGIDVSGSISTSTYDQFMSDTINLFKKYRADGELLHWDTEINAKGKIMENKLHYMNNLEVRGGGGTSTDCIFEYYDMLSKNKKPSLTIILTDGYIDMTNNKKWAKNYKKTIWIICDDGNKDFKPPFGKVVFM